MKRWQSLLIGIVVSVVMLYYALRGVDLGLMTGELTHINLGWATIAFMLTILSLWLRAMRWRFLLNNKMTRQHSFSISNAAYLFNTFLPLRLGEVVRAYMVTRLDPPIPMFTALSSVLVERLTDVLAVVICVVLAILMAPVNDATITTGALLTGAVAVLGTLMLVVFAVRRELAHQILNFVLRILPFLNRINPTHLLDRILDGIAPLGNARSAIIIVGWSVVAWVASITQMIALMFAFYGEGHVRAVLLAISIASLAVAIPAVPGNVGPFEAAMKFALVLGGVIPANPSAEELARALAYAITLHFMNVALYAILGIIGIFQEKISFGELLQSARQIASRSEATPQPES